MDFRVGDLVWAKMKGFPAWPARIMEPLKGKRLHHKVFFFGTGDHAWIPDELINHHSNEMLRQCALKKVSPTLLAAMEEITEAAKDFVRADPPKDAGEVSIKSKLAEKYRRLKAAKKVKSQSLAKKRIFGIKHLPPMKGRKRPKAVVPPYDDVEMRQNAPVPTQKKKIGFLGLGMMGQRIVANLLKTGHQVTVWNRTPDRCDHLIRVGACRGKTIADVICASDITFCCMADPDVSRHILFCVYGVLFGLEGSERGSKGYVELSALDPRTSMDIESAITFQGGRYLEAPMGGTCQSGEEGNLIVYGSGDFDLFHECESVFHAISKHAYLISDKVGGGASMSLIHSMLVGTMCASLGEAFALADRAKIPKNSFLDVLKLIGMTCPLMMEKGRTMIERHLPPNVPLKNQQLHMHLALLISHANFQPMPIASAGNELYKHAKRLGYGRKDAAAVFTATKF